MDGAELFSALAGSCIPALCRLLNIFIDQKWHSPATESRRRLVFRAVCMQIEKDAKARGSLGACTRDIPQGPGRPFLCRRTVPAHRESRGSENQTQGPGRPFLARRTGVPAHRESRGSENQTQGPGRPFLARRTRVPAHRESRESENQTQGPGRPFLARRTGVPAHRESRGSENQTRRTPREAVNFFSFLDGDIKSRGRNHSSERKTLDQPEEPGVLEETFTDTFKETVRNMETTWSHRLHRETETVRSTLHKLVQVWRQIFTMQQAREQCGLKTPADWQGFLVLARTAELQSIVQAMGCLILSTGCRDDVISELESQNHALVDGLCAYIGRVRDLLGRSGLIPTNLGSSVGIEKKRRKHVSHAENFAKSPCIRELSKKKMEAVAVENYELAAHYRDKILQLRKMETGPIGRVVRTVVCSRTGLRSAADDRIIKKASAAIAEILVPGKGSTRHIEGASATAEKKKGKRERASPQWRPETARADDGWLFERAYSDALSDRPRPCTSRRGTERTRTSTRNRPRSQKKLSRTARLSQLYHRVKSVTSRTHQSCGCSGTISHEYQCGLCGSVTSICMLCESVSPRSSTSIFSKM